MPMYRGLTKALKHEGYQERRDLFGAPYDFRMAADGLEQVILGYILTCGWWLMPSCCCGVHNYSAHIYLYNICYNICFNICFAVQLVCCTSGFSGCEES